MTKTRILAAAAVLSMIASTQVFAQAAIGSPGVFSFYYPDRDVLNGGAPISAPSTSGTASARLRNHRFYGTMNSASNTSCAERYHSYAPKSGTFLGDDGRRHPCK